MLAAIMANKGKFKQHVYFKEETWEKMHSEPIVRKDDNFANATTNFTIGGFNRFDSDSGMTNPPNCPHNVGFVGWMGGGGSIF